MSHFTLAALPSGQQQLTLKPIGGKTERRVYWGVIGAAWLGGLALVPSNLGFGVLAVALVCSIAMARLTSRTEVWLLEPGSGTRVVSGWGNSRERYVPMKVLVVAERDSDERSVVRLMLQHTAGTVQIGTDTYDRDERALELARAFAAAAGIEVQGGDAADRVLQNTHE